MSQVKLTRSLGWGDLKKQLVWLKHYLEMEVHKTKIQLKLLYVA